MGYFDENVTAVSRIKPTKAYPFEITSVRTESKGNIEVTLRTETKPEGTEYIVDVKNLKKEEAKYSDTIFLKTTDKVNTELKLRVYGQIMDRAAHDVE